jgi:membrane protein
MQSSRLTTSEQVASAWHLGGLTFRELSKRVFRGIREDDLLSRASDLAFNSILALFPLLLFLLSLLGIFESHSDELRTRLLTYFAQLLPPAGFRILDRTLIEISMNANTGKVTFGIVLAVWFASGGMSSMISGLNRVYEVNDSRSWIKVRAISIGLTVAIAVLIVSALVTVLAGGYIANSIGTHYGLHELTIIVERIAQNVIALVFVTLAFSLIYYFGADLQEQHWYWITPGSVTGVLLWVLASLSFRAYLHFFNSYSKTYGSLGAAMILLIWLFITGFAFLVGGEVNAQIEHAAALRGHPEAKAPGEKKAA